MLRVADAAERDPAGNPPGLEPGLWGVVLAAGEGLRLQPFLTALTGRVARKQFCPVGERPLIRDTFARTELLIPRERLVTVVGAGMEAEAAPHLSDRPPETVIWQPLNRETGPGVLLPCCAVAAADPDACVAVFPADHYVHQAALFMERVRDAKRAVDAHPGLLVLLGVEADSPETGYGWIAAGDPAEEAGTGRLHRVERFREKPDPRTAAGFLAAGFLWNTLVMVARVRTFLRLFAAYLPEVARQLGPVRAAWGTARWPGAVQAAYADMPAVTVSHGILEHNPSGLRVLPVRGVLWSDWGSPARICQTLGRVGRTHLLTERFRVRGLEPVGALAGWCEGHCRVAAG
ncbi:MAG TPA: sugar phosphate nucleotidyltransferase [Candidatus Methylomirabilis sp.]|jgi:mannose-1-phosphate guanylyltransferase|nr:sugar phosphate nucleotidyltransferase [Candidatus Methylomirabilis sp.]